MTFDVRTPLSEHAARWLTDGATRDSDGPHAHLAHFFITVLIISARPGRMPGRVSMLVSVLSQSHTTHRG